MHKLVRRSTSSQRGSKTIKVDAESRHRGSVRSAAAMPPMSPSPPTPTQAHQASTVRQGIWQVIYQDTVGPSDVRPPDAADNESILPSYEPPSRCHSHRTSSTTLLSVSRGDRTLAGGPPSAPLSTQSDPRQSQSFLQIEPPEAYTYAYTLFAGNAHLQVIILVEAEPDRPNHYTFSLSMKVGDVERAVAKPVVMRLSIDPRGLNFVVFAFPPRSSIPVGCLYNLRVWLRTAGADHRLFGEKDLWFGRDPNFSAIPDVSIASLRSTTDDVWIYQGLVGHARVTFIIRLELVEPGVYALSLDYEAGGVGRTLFENYHLRFYCEPHAVSYVIYSIPVSSTPAGASHRLRVWLRTPHRPHARARVSSPPPSGSRTDSFLYQRLWKSDDFKIGARLRFDAIGSSIVLATRASAPTPILVENEGRLQTLSTTSSSELSRMPTLTPNRRVSRLTPHVGVDDTDESINDR